jgi:hypothetical protein
VNTVLVENPLQLKKKQIECFQGCAGW